MVMNISIRQTIPSDVEICGQIIYEAFKGIYEKHGYPLAFANLENAINCAQFQISHPSIYGIVAVKDNKIVGSNFLDQRNSIYGIGPLTVDPQMQGYGIGRLLMETILEIGEKAPGIRLIQDTFNTSSLSLYTSLGFSVKEPLIHITGKLKDKPSTDIEVRPLETNDLEECAALCKSVLCYERTNDLRDALKYDLPLVALRQQCIVAYATELTQWTANHAVAEREEDLLALLLAANVMNEKPLSFLLPTRKTSLLSWCFKQGLKVVSPHTLMCMGDYQEPKGSYLPSIFY